MQNLELYNRGMEAKELVLRLSVTTNGAFIALFKRFTNSETGSLKVSDDYVEDLESSASLLQRLKKLYLSRS